MDISLLEELGLTQREIKTYCALLKTGPSTVGKIIKESGIPSSKIYEVLEKLKQRGLVSSIIKQNRQQFSAAEPATLLTYLDEQRRRVAETVVPKLEQMRASHGPAHQATVYEGVRAIKTIYDLMLKVPRGETIYVLGAPKTAQDLFGSYLQLFNTLRVKKGIHIRIIYTYDSRETAYERAKLPLTEVAYLKKDSLPPSWIDVFGVLIATFVFFSLFLS